MLKEKNPLLKLNVKKEKYKISQSFTDAFEGLFGLYDYLLDEPIENIWYESTSIIVSYLQIMSFMFNEEVSII